MTDTAGVSLSLNVYLRSAKDEEGSGIVSLHKQSQTPDFFRILDYLVLIPIYHLCLSVTIRKDTKLQKGSTPLFCCEKSEVKYYVTVIIC